MSWDAAPPGSRGRQQTYSDAAIQTCFSMEVLFGMALRQTTGFVESLLRLVGLDWTVPDFSTLSCRQKPRVVNIPYRGSKGPLHLLFDSPGIGCQNLLSLFILHRHALARRWFGWFGAVVAPVPRPLRPPSRYRAQR